MSQQHTTTPDALIPALKLIVGEANLLLSGVHDDALTPYLEESRQRVNSVCQCIVFPSTTAEVAQIVATCRHHKTPIVPIGGNSGRCLGAHSDDPATVMLSLKKLNRVREIDIANRTITVEAGCILQTIQETAEKHGLFFPLSLGAEGSCQIGGNLATNAGGINVLRYGNTRDLTLGVEAVIPNGTVFNGLSALRKDNTGYDLKNLLIGSEGTLGIITAATFTLSPPERNNEHGFIAVNTIEDAITCLHQTNQVFTGKVSCFEIIPNLAMQWLEKHSDLRCPIGNNHPWYIWYKIASANPDDSLAEDNLACLEALMEDGIVIDATVSQNEAMKTLFWQIRETLVEVQKFEGASVKFDVSVPISSVAKLINTGYTVVNDLCPDIRPYPFGHLGDGNIHFNLSRPETMSDETFVNHYKATLVEALHDLVDGLDGSFSAEHGIGSQKIADMAKYKDPIALDMMRRIKHAFDPLNLMNPGKVIPPLK
ncbi:FAD-binding oxidoreductase [Ostreibacterium oceani]|uniref:FAD-binding protein n=1 Tax=Ostreibacterium oceani TaxID=2654998 RepID=A0A6N7EX47_9GAMM|nr:FAD-binding oxidoreductase [Ostreibacterium oceani]MPV85707.1 FAD-binding protein [Ostreibacterium oceani]